MTGLPPTQPLTSDHIKHFQREGYVVVPQFFAPEEIRALLAELDRFLQEGMLRNVATDGDGKTPSTVSDNLQICPITPHSSLYRALHYSPRVVNAVRQLVGDPLLFYLDQIFLKPDKTGVGTDWHQDNAYFKVSDPTKGVALWAALHDATEANGTLRVIPGSHEESYPHERDPNSNHHIHCSPPEDRAVPLELPQGGIAFFNFGIAHCTKSNLSNKPRAGLALHFLRTDYIPEESRQGNVAHLTGPDATGGLKEYGVWVEGTWEDEMHSTLAKVGLGVRE